MKTSKNCILFIISLILIQSCIEPFDFNSTTVEENLVVRALLTNEYKKHSIELSRTIPIDSTKLEPEKNAIITITDDIGGVYSFQENQDGIYTSNSEFSAEPERAYILNIKSQNGNTYISSAEKLPSISEVQDIDFIIENNQTDNSQEVIFRVSSALAEGEGKYYRYEYDETSKISPPFWSDKKILIVSDTPPYEFDLVGKDPITDGTGVCYKNNHSRVIMLTETKTLSQDKVTNFSLRKIPLNSYLIGLRYSILVKQYTLNQNTFDFYNLLSKFSNPDNIFSQIQVGNIPSNISHTSDINQKKVIGFFEVSSVSTKRSFFNRDDITDTHFKNYIDLPCRDTVSPRITDSNGKSPLLEKLQLGWIYLYDYENWTPNVPFTVIQKPCGDCSHLGPVTKPEFWID